MRRVLMICYYFPPLGGIGSLRAAKFATYLPQFGWEPTVVAPRAGAYHRDEALPFPEAKVQRTASLEISRLGKRAMGLYGGDTSPVTVGVPLGRLRSFVRRWLYRPDGQIGWYPWAVQAGRRALLETRYDAIFSSSFPITAHLVARRLRRDSQVPWVAEFRDLWTELAPYDSALRRRFDLRLERSILLTASEIITVSPSWSAALQARSTRRVSVITNGFDPEDLPEVAAPRQPVVTYLGTYYPERQDLRTPLLALGEFARAGTVDGFVFRIVGELPRALEATLGEAGLLPSLEVTGFVPHVEAVRQIRSSSLLLLAGLRSASAASPLRGQIVAKVFEYLGSQRPILYVGETDTDVVRLLRPFAGVGIVRSGDVAGAKREIVRLLQAGPQVLRSGLEPYTHRALAGRLAGVLSRACE